MRPKSHIEGDVAILSYDLDETETIFGQNLTARYHETDTWMRRGGKWQIVAGQVLRYYEDPAPGKADTSKFPSYLGTYRLGPERTMTDHRGRRPSLRGAQLAVRGKNLFRKPAIFSSAKAWKAASCLATAMMVT